MNEFKSFFENAQVGERAVIGTGQNCGVVLDQNGISVEHCLLLRREEGFFVRDLDSENGTSINGQEIVGFARLMPGDTLLVGNYPIPIPHGPQAINETSANFSKTDGLPIQLSAATKTVRIREEQGTNQRNILDAANVVIHSGEFFGIVGASGSGKSTLISSLAGFQSLTSGKILINGEQVGPDELKVDPRIAYLPQDVVIHQALPTGTVLDYIAQLKGLGETAEDRRLIVESTLERTGMLNRIDVPVHRLSGGQRKRVALSAQLIGDPQILLLDEATSGLDPATEREMMELFQSLSQEGKTVICITHSPANLHACDRLVVLEQGSIVFCGTPSELNHFFGVENIEDMFTVQNAKTPEQWQAKFRKTDNFQSTTTPPSIAPEQTLASQDIDQFEQARTLLKRYLQLQLHDYKNLLLLFFQAPIIGLMIAATYGSIEIDFAQLHAAKTKEVSFLLILSVLWCSGTASVREIVKESTILRHELRFGVGLIPYLLSKFCILSVFAMIQATVLFAVVSFFTELPGSWIQQWVVLLATSVVGVSIGLFISSIAGTSERAMTVLPILLVAQAIFSGGLARMEGLTLWIARTSVPAYWGLDGIKSSLPTDLNIATYAGAPGHFQAPILGLGGPLTLDLFALFAQCLALQAIAYLTLHFTLRTQLGFGNIKKTLIDHFPFKK